MKVSVIIPVFNEANVIGDCLDSLMKQSFKDLEIIVDDDGSTDKTIEEIEKFNVQALKQSHQGPGLARNLGAKSAKGQILVFVDADMTFDKNFVRRLVEPIIDGKVIGTFSKEEYVSNEGNIWSKCWNINREAPFNKMHSDDYPDEQKVFRAILKKEFDKTEGFKPIGYIDDHTVSDQLGVMATVASGAIFYHKNPETLAEVFTQARWIGKSEYKGRKIKNEGLMRLVSIIRYSLPMSLLNGLIGFIKSGSFQYLIFKIVYDLAIEISLVGSFLGEQPYK